MHLIVVVLAAYITTSAFGLPIAQKKTVDESGIITPRWIGESLALHKVQNQVHAGLGQKESPAVLDIVIPFSTPDDKISNMPTRCLLSSEGTRKRVEELRNQLKNGSHDTKTSNHEDLIKRLHSYRRVEERTDMERTKLKERDAYRCMYMESLIRERAKMDASS